MLVNEALLCARLCVYLPSAPDQIGRESHIKARTKEEIGHSSSLSAGGGEGMEQQQDPPSDMPMGDVQWRGDCDDRA